MKKLTSALLTISLCLGLTACGGGSAATPTATPSAGNGGETAAPGKVYSIGICQLTQHDALDAATKGFKDAVIAGLGEDHVKFDEQNANGDSATCSTIVTGFAANGYDLIMANATPALQAAVAATSAIPILGTSVTDYGEALNLKDMDPAAGTGINVAGSSDGVDAQLFVDLLTELCPNARKVSILHCSAEANSVFQASTFRSALPAGIESNVFTFTDSNDIQAVVTSAVEDADALYIPSDNQAASNMQIISNVCQNARIPIICGEEHMCANGSLATVALSYYEIGKLCGEQAIRILRDGADVSKMPIAYASNPVKKYNPAYAEAIGFTVPEGYIAVDG